MKNFILFGAAGYVAPKHMKAIKENGGNLIAICDPHDSVGVIDSYFPECRYFKDLERLDNHYHKLKRKGINIDYVVVSSPNFLHDAHCRWSLRVGSDVICEKPLVLFERDLDVLIDLEKETNKKVYGLYQLRYHPLIKEMREIVSYTEGNIVNIEYNTPRGNWYLYSWKGIKEKSGGIETNIGCHLFDICSYMFGKYESIEIKERQQNYSEGKINYINGEVNWKLSIKPGKPERKFIVNGKEFVFDLLFSDLHTIAYTQILNGKGIPLESFRQSIKICEEIRKNGKN